MKFSHLKTVELVKQLDNMRPPSVAKITSHGRQRAERIAKWIMGLAGVTFAVLGTFAAWHKFVSELSGTAKTIALVFGTLSMALPLLSILVSIASDFWEFLNFNKNQLHRYLVELENDEAHVSALMSESKDDLERTQKLIQLKATRIRNRLGMFIGGPDKIALFSLAGIGWAVLKELSSKDSSAFAAGPFLFGVHMDVYTLLQYAAALFTGMAFGAVMMSYQLRRYVYQLELLDLAISRKPKAGG